MGGDKTTIPLDAVLKKGIHLVGSTLRSRSFDVKAELLKELVKIVWPKIQNGEIRPVIHSVFPIEEAEKAQSVMKQNENTGKIVLQVRDRTKLP
ncbi:MAG: zinc-binding dehydrogenase [Clostridia bacterium]|nr:zinc-binding dehydrogenase [Clostridia bacterium]